MPKIIRRSDQPAISTPMTINTSATAAPTHGWIAALPTTTVRMASFASFSPVSTRPKGEKAMSTLIACELSHTTRKAATATGTVIHGVCTAESAMEASGSIATPEDASR